MKFRWAIIFAWTLIFLLSALILPRVTSHLKSGFGLVDTESRKALEVLKEKFETTETSLIAVFYSSHITIKDPSYREQVEIILAPLEEHPDVVGIRAFYDSNIPDMVSPDGHTTYAIISLDQSIDEAIDSFPELEQSLSSGDLQVWITGGVPIFSDINQASEKDLRRGEIIAIPLVLIALIIVFRSLVAAIIPVAMGVLSVSLSLALIYFVSLTFDISIFAINLISFLGLGVAVDYSLLLVNRFREELNHWPKEEAVSRTLTTSGKTILFAALTSALGLSSLLIFNFMMLRSLGLGGILVITVSLLLALTLIPAILAVVGHQVNALPILHTRTRGPAYWRGLALTAMRHPFFVAIPMIILLLVLGTPFVTVKLGSPWASILPENAASRQGWDMVSENIGPGEISPIVALVTLSDPTSPLNGSAPLRQLVHTLERDSRVDRIESIFTPAPASFGMSSLPQHPTNKAIEGYIRGDTTVIQVFSRYSPVEDESRELVKYIRSLNPNPEFNILVTGATADLMDSIDLMYSDFPKAIGFVLATVYVVLLLLFRSVLLPLKAVVMNLMSIFASYGALVFIFQQGHLQAFLGFRTEGFTEATLPILLFAVIFGLSMDYEIFLLSRIKESHDASGNNTESVAQGLEVTGPIITSAAIILILVATAFASADIIIIKALGLGTAIAIFIDATVVRALLVPALMQIMGRWNWWAPSLLRRSIPQW